jgi:hypothetical protein
MAWLSVREMAGFSKASILGLGAWWAYWGFLIRDFFFVLLGCEREEGEERGKLNERMD